jgi:hypothetical protein
MERPGTCAAVLQPALKVPRHFDVAPSRIVRTMAPDFVLAIRGDGRGIPALGVARRSNTSGILPPHALIAGRLARFGTTRHFQHWSHGREHALPVDRQDAVLGRRRVGRAVLRAIEAGEAVVDDALGVAGAEGREVHAVELDQPVEGGEAVRRLGDGAAAVLRQAAVGGLDVEAILRMRRSADSSDSATAKTRRSHGRAC